MTENTEEPNCANCPLRAKAEAKPKSFLGWFWHWHIKWCPGWKAYQESLEQSET